MELIELDATAQRALELLTNAGMSDGSIYDYTHTGFGSILRHFHTKGILYATAEMLDNFLLEQRVLFNHGTLYGIVQSKSSNTTHRRRNSLPNRKIFMCLSGWSTSVWNNLAFRKIRFAITRKRD